MDIKRVIKSYGWTIERLAAEMPNKYGGKGIRQTSLSSIINGNPTISSLISIANIIGCTVSELIDENNTTTTKCPHCGHPIVIKLK